MKCEALAVINRQMQGFTLIELVVAIGIAGVVVAAASLTVMTLLRLTPPTGDYMVAYQQVQNAGYWLVKDINMSYQATEGEGNPTLLTLKQRRTPTTEVTVTYELKSSGSSYKLVRKEGNTETVVAEHVASAIASTENCRVTFSLTVRVKDKQVTRTYEATCRLAAQGQ